MSDSINRDVVTIETAQFHRESQLWGIIRSVENSVKEMESTVREIAQVVWGPNRNNGLRGDRLETNKLIENLREKVQETEVSIAKIPHIISMSIDSHYEDSHRNASVSGATIAGIIVSSLVGICGLVVALFK